MGLREYGRDPGPLPRFAIGTALPKRKNLELLFLVINDRDCEHNNPFKNLQRLVDFFFQVPLPPRRLITFTDDYVT